jgi:hypothetical protein
MNERRAVTKRILVFASETDGPALEQVIRSCARGADAEVLVIAPEPGQAEACLERLSAAGPAGFSVQSNVAIYAVALSRQTRCPDGFTPASAASFPSADRNGDGFVCVHAIDN